MRAWSRALLAAYLAILLWLVLFKLSFDVSGVLRDSQTRVLNLVPFAGVSWTHAGELIANVLVFVPLGLLLGVELKRPGWWWKLAVICLLSVALETTQYVLAIGRTDVITNAVGGLVGLVLYGGAAKRVPQHRLDRGIVVAGTILLVLALLLRFLVLRVRY